MFRNVLIFLVVVGAAIFVATLLRRPKRLFEIRIGEGDVKVVGPVPNHEQRQVREFVESLRLPIGARVTAVDKGLDYALTFSRSIRQEDRDRLRQFIRGSD